VILADTSAWVEYDRATGSQVDLRLRDLIAADGPIAVTEPVIMEVLAGARSDARETDLRRLLLRFHLCAFDAAAELTADQDASMCSASSIAAATSRSTVGDTITLTVSSDTPPRVTSVRRGSTRRPTG